jgi:DNA-binding winged helix-turn-helix (wHTH) protein/predicted ATPase
MEGQKSLPARHFVFEPFRLDIVDERLWMHDRCIKLAHKAYAVLARLVSQPGLLIAKEDLLAAAWPDTAVTDAVLTTAMRELRQALGDEARIPRFIETVHGRGYRFIAPVVRSDTGATGAELLRRLVGREKESARLHELYAVAQQGMRRIVFVAGEAGIGKTALVDDFVFSVKKFGNGRTGHGQCIENYGSGEAYLPILEALNRFGRDSSIPLRDVLREHASSWLAHLRSLSCGDLPPLPVTTARMLRELADAFEILTARDPLVLVLEDLHWCDTATLGWLAYIARRRDPARLLVIGTFRPVEALLHNQALRKLVAEIAQQPQCAEIVLDYLSPDAVEAYIQQRCGQIPHLKELCGVLCRRTGGQPLFLTAIVDEWVRQENFNSSDLAVIGNMIPAGVRQFIEHRFEALPAEDRRILQAASVAGEAFSVASVAAATSLPEAGIESRCAAWERGGQFVIADGTAAWPDGTLAARYRFRHALYQEVVYSGISPEQRADLHLATGDRMEAAHRSRSAAIAAELAMHFEQGRDLNRAVPYLARAARNALDRSAYQEAATHLERGLKLLEGLAEGVPRVRLELELNLLLGRVLAATKGWAVEQVETTYLRAQYLCEQLEDTNSLFQVLWGLIGVAFVRADFRRAQAIGRMVLGHAKDLRDPVYGVLGHMEVAGTAFHLGEPPAASQRHFARAAALYKMDQHRSYLACFGVDMGLFSSSWSTHFLWHKGYADRAREQSERTVGVARDLSHPLTLAVALAYAAMLYQFCRDVKQVDVLADLTIRLCSEHGFPYYLAWAEVLRGWSIVAQGDHTTGIAGMRRGIEVLEAKAGARLSYYRALLAEAYASCGRIDQAHEALEGAFADIARSEERWWEPELHRLRGALLLSGTLKRHVEAEACFQRAIDVARGQQAKPLELRAALSLAGLWREQARHADAHSIVKDVHDWFTEGTDLDEMRAAKTFLSHAVEPVRKP